MGLTLIVTSLLFGDASDEFIIGVIRDSINTQVLASYRRYYIEASIIEPNEDWFIVPRYFNVDLESLTDRQHKMKVDCPLAVEINLLPDKEFAWQQKQVANKWVKYCEQKLIWAGGAEVATAMEWLADAEYRHKLWSRIYYTRVAATGYSRLGVRLELQELRDLVSYKAFYNSYWPDSIPPVAYNFDWGYK